MINSVRNTVLSILNKNNYGYISPADFNLFAKQAQLDIFEDYFYQYNYQINKENARQSGTGYADITKGYGEVINIFSETKFLSHDNNNKFFTPSQITTNDDYYLLNKVLVYTTILTSGINDAVVVNKLRNTTGNFIASGVQVGDIVANITTNTTAIVTNVNSSSILTLDANIFLATGNQYVIYDDSVVNEAEKLRIVK